METKEEHPELNLSKFFVEHLASHLRVPEENTCKHGEYHGSKNNVVEMSHNEVTVTQREV